MISEGSCDTENWSNAENSALPLKEYITFYNILKWKIYFIILFSLIYFQF